jgi:hypothetical protein
MRLQAIFVSLVLAVGCGGGSDPDPEAVFVTDLSAGGQADLCEQFLDAFCAANTFCDDDCINEGCTPAADNGNIEEECDPDGTGGVTIDEVLDCGDDGTEAVCGTPGTNDAGCIGDALVAACTQ